MSRRRRSTNGGRRRLDVDSDRHRLLLSGDALRLIVVLSPLEMLAGARSQRPTQRLRLLRGADLLNLWAVFYRCRLGHYNAVRGPFVVRRRSGQVGGPGRYRDQPTSFLNG